MIASKYDREDAALNDMKVVSHIRPNRMLDGKHRDRRTIWSNGLSLERMDMIT